MTTVIIKEYAEQFQPGDTVMIVTDVFGSKACYVGIFAYFTIHNVQFTNSFGFQQNTNNNIVFLYSGKSIPTSHGQVKLITGVTNIVSTRAVLIEKIFL